MIVGLTLGGIALVIISFYLGALFIGLPLTRGRPGDLEIHRDDEDQIRMRRVIRPIGARPGGTMQSAYADRCEHRNPKGPGGRL